MKKRILVALLAGILVSALTYGCGRREAEPTDKEPLEVKQAERMDSTRLDSAIVDTDAGPGDTTTAGD